MQEKITRCMGCNLSFFLMDPNDNLEVALRFSSNLAYQNRMEKKIWINIIQVNITFFRNMLTKLWFLKKQIIWDKPQKSRTVNLASKYLHGIRFLLRVSLSMGYLVMYRKTRWQITFLGVTAVVFSLKNILNGCAISNFFNSIITDSTIIFRVVFENHLDTYLLLSSHNSGV